MVTKKKATRKKSTRKKAAGRDASQSEPKTFTMRFPHHLHEALREAAAWNRRSVNMQIATYLEADLYSDGYLPEPSFHLDDVDRKPNKQPLHGKQK